MSDKRTIMPISEIKVDKEIYPRETTLWGTEYKYSIALKSGAIFPPILVGKYLGETILIDGLHRINAHKRNHSTNIDAITRNYTDKATMLMDAIKSNVEHGANLKMSELTKAIMALRTQGITDAQISKVVNMPIETIKPFMLKRTVNTITGEEIPITAPLSYMAGRKISNQEIALASQLPNQRTEYFLRNLITIFETKLINLKNPKILNQVKTLHKLTGQAIMSTRRR